MDLLSFPSFDQAKPTALLYFQLTLNNRLFGHTLRQIYLPFFRRWADRAGYNLVYVSPTVSGSAYVEKHASGIFDAIVTSLQSERLEPPNTYRDLFKNYDFAPIKSLNPTKLIALTTPLVIRNDVKAKPFDKLLDAKLTTFASIAKAWTDFLGCAWFANELNLKVDHVIVDPLEASYDDLQGFSNQGQRYFLYESPSYNAKALHITEDAYRHTKRNTLIDMERDHDVMIGYSITQKPRLWLQEYDFEEVLKTSGLKYRVFLKDSYRNIDTFVWDKVEYLGYLATAKYTLVIPSYDINAFSTIRFIESLFQGNCPLILDKCNLTEAFTSAEQAMLAPLVVSDKTLPDVIKATSYDDKLAELQNWFLRDKPLQVSL